MSLMTLRDSGSFVSSINRVQTLKMNGGWAQSPVIAHNVECILAGVEGKSCEIPSRFSKLAETKGIPSASASDMQ